MNNLKNALYVVIFIGTLFLISQTNYLLFHSLAELFSIVIAFGIFVIGWNSRKYYKNNYLLFIGIAYVFVAFFDTLHMLAYKGMTVFKGYDDNNLPPQLWLVARYIESTTLLIAPLFISRSFYYRRIVFSLFTISLLAIYAIFYSRVFPDCFVTGSGLTKFKITSEYIINGILLIALYLLYKKKEHFDPHVLKLLTASIICTMITELCFTVYVHLYGISNLIGHLFKIFSFYFMYKAVIETALTKPYDLLFKELQIQTDTLSELLDINQEIISESPAAILAYRIDTGGCVLANESAAQSTGATTTELLLQNFRNIPSWQQSGLLDAVNAVIASGRPYKGRFQLTTSFSKTIIFDGFINIFSSGGIQHIMLIFEDITERIHQEDKIKSNEEFTRSVLNSLAAHIAVIDQTGTIVMVNEAWRNFAEENGANPETCSENSNYLKVCENSVDQTIRDCHTALLEIIHGKRQNFRCEYPCNTLDGEARCFLMRAEPLRHADGGAVISHYDISERKLFESELRNSELRYRSLFNGMTEGFALHEIICDDEGQPCDYRFIDINPAFEKLTGLSREIVLGKCMSEILTCAVNSEHHVLSYAASRCR